jgi:hypothetical protein
MSIMAEIKEIINFPHKKKLTPAGIKYMRVAAISAPWIIAGRHALRSTFSKELLHERWTLGAAGNGCASRVWKGDRIGHFFV